jgi:AcrR family transcriptional regulator
MADPRPERTRRRLISAARELIAEKGVAGLRIAELTDAASVGMGSFYNHFATKEALVEAVASESLRALAAEIVSVNGDGDGDRGGRFGDAAVVPITALRRFVRLAYDDPEFSRIVVNLSRGEELFVEAISPYARTALDRAVDAGAYEIEDVDVAATAIIAGALAVIRRILDGELGANADVPLARMVLRGFGVAPDEATRISNLDLPTK